MPHPPRRNPGPPSPARRKVLLVFGFGAANTVLLRRIDRPTAGADADVSDTRSTDAERREPVVLEGVVPVEPEGHTFDVAIVGGRVIDPDSGYDRSANVGLDGTVITAITEKPLTARLTVDASGLVVSPGFIDLLSFEPNPVGDPYKIGDGVTTALGMHGLDFEAAEFFERYEARCAYNYGGAWDDAFERGIKREIDVGAEASQAELSSLVASLEEGIAAGWVGMSSEPEYTPGASFDELRSLAEVAAAHGVPAFFHVRYSDPDPPGTNAEAIQEVIEIARATGAAVHVDHITSTGGTFTMAETLATIAAARDEGLDVTACMYPYDSWGTYLNSTRFNDGWQERFRISYDDLQVAGTVERLNRSSFEQAKEDNSLVVAYAIPDEDLEAALRADFVMIASDGLIEEGGNNHPRGAGCFSRVLGRYVREKQILTLPEALAKMTIMPARRIEGGAPAMARKGRIQVGADADITIFDPATVEDRATVANPEQLSAGIEWVFVNGQVAKDPSGVRTETFAGQPIRSASSTTGG